MHRKSKYSNQTLDLTNAALEATVIDRELHDDLKTVVEKYMIAGMQIRNPQLAVIQQLLQHLKEVGRATRTLAIA
jgi:spore coat protein CotF